jgi:hypothetical protein
MGQQSPSWRATRQRQERQAAPGAHLEQREYLRRNPDRAALGVQVRGVGGRRHGGGGSSSAPPGHVAPDAAGHQAGGGHAAGDARRNEDPDHARGHAAAGVRGLQGGGGGYRVCVWGGDSWRTVALVAASLTPSPAQPGPARPGPPAPPPTSSSPRGSGRQRPGPDGPNHHTPTSMAPHLPAKREVGEARLGPPPELDGDVVGSDALLEQAGAHVVELRQEAGVRLYADGVVLTQVGVVHLGGRVCGGGVQRQAGAHAASRGERRRRLAVAMLAMLQGTAAQQPRKPQQRPAGLLAGAPGGRWRAACPG